MIESYIAGLVVGAGLELLVVGARRGTGEEACKVRFVGVGLGET